MEWYYPHSGSLFFPSYIVWKPSHNSMVILIPSGGQDPHHNVFHTAGGSSSTWWALLETHTHNTLEDE